MKNPRYFICLISIVFYIQRSNRGGGIKVDFHPPEFQFFLVPRERFEHMKKRTAPSMNYVCNYIYI